MGIVIGYESNNFGRDEKLTYDVIKKHSAHFDVKSTALCYDVMTLLVQRFVAGELDSENASRSEYEKKAKVLDSWIEKYGDYVIEKRSELINQPLYDSGCLSID